MTLCRVTRLGIFCQLGYFWMRFVTFQKDVVAQRNVDILGNFLLKQIFYSFT